MLKQILIVWFFFSGSQLGEAKKESLGVYPVQQHAQYGQLIDRLKAFVTQKAKQRRNHFFISDVTKERMTNVLGETTNNDYAYAYWEENDAIIILSFPLADLDWLERKSYIDLRKQVVPDGKYANLGCCLVEEDWVRRIVHSCKRGKRLVLQKTTRQRPQRDEFSVRAFPRRAVRTEHKGNTNGHRIRATPSIDT